MSRQNSETKPKQPLVNVVP